MDKGIDFSIYVPLVQGAYLKQCFHENKYNGSLIY